MTSQDSAVDQRTGTGTAPRRAPGPDGDDAAILTEGLIRNFGESCAVDHVDLRIAPGEIYGFLGPNGAGKSTTVRMLCTLLAPSGGRALVAGHDVATEAGKVRLRIGVALQDAALDPNQTGIELRRLQGMLYGISKRTMAQRVNELAELIDIGDALGRRVGTYSGGMKRRLDLAAALVHSPPPVSTRSAGPRSGPRSAASTASWA
jgi:ABC-2 type transport system ATP-binding protein